MIIDCDRCAVRDIACADCVVTALLGLPEGAVEVDAAEQAALGALAAGGLVPPLRLVTGDPADPADPGAARADAAGTTARRVRGAATG